jgi:hypothetical protein
MKLFRGNSLGIIISTISCIFCKPSAQSRSLSQTEAWYHKYPASISRLQTAKSAHPPILHLPVPPASAWQTFAPILKLHTNALLPRSLLHQIRQPQVLPSSLLGLLRSSLNAKRCMLVRHYIVLIFWINGLVMGRHVDFVVRELVFAEIFEEVRVS